MGIKFRMDFEFNNDMIRFKKVDCKLEGNKVVDKLKNGNNRCGVFIMII